VTVNEHNDAALEPISSVFYVMGLAAFSRLGPFCAANWFGGQRLMCCGARRVRGHGLLISPMRTVFAVSKSLLSHASA
jgi:hypothetical protein